SPSRSPRERSGARCARPHDCEKRTDTVTRAVLHVDMDAFYASVEEHDDPRLAGRPLIVRWDGGRGVVAAASYAVRRYGVHSAMPMRTALRLCPQAICVRPRMQRYQEVSRIVFGVRSEERRVGKECGERWWRAELKKRW